MKTEKELNDDILKITMKIKSEFTELSKYLEELAVTIPDTEDPEINIKHLQNYYDSLEALLKKYETNHKDVAK